MAEDEPLVLFEEVGENKNIALIKLNRPRKLNTLNGTMLDLLQTKFKSLKKNPSFLAVIIFAEGKSWCAGVDLNWFMKLKWRSMKIIRRGQRVFNKIDKHPTPVIAAINGYAIGGGLELALSCDIRIASDTASFGQTETRIGIPPGWGGTYRLPKIVGLSVAKDLILTGRRFTVEEALEIGLISKIVPTNELRDQAIAIAEEITHSAPVAVRKAKKAIKKGYHNSTWTGYRAERKGIRRCFRTKDLKEGIKAVLEKRKPEFKGK